MSRVIKKTVFKFEELSDRAKEKARDWWRGCENQNCDLLDRDDIGIIAAAIGIEFDTRAVKLMGGGTRHEAKIYYSGFSSQGDGASFEGRYSYVKGSRAKLAAHAPQDAELRRIAEELFQLQRRNFYRLEARMTRGSGSNYYSHSGTMSVDVSRNGDDAPREIEDEINQLMRDFADWIYSQLRDEYEYRMSDENVDESIKINEYEFDEYGKIV